MLPLAVHPTSPRRQPRIDPAHLHRSPDRAACPLRPASARGRRRRPLAPRRARYNWRAERPSSAEPSAHDGRDHCCRSGSHRSRPWPRKAGWAARSDRRGRARAGRTRRAGTSVEDPARGCDPALACPSRERRPSRFPGLHQLAPPRASAASTQQGEAAPGASDQNRHGQGRLRTWWRSHASAIARHARGVELFGEHRHERVSMFHPRGAV